MKTFRVTFEVTQENLGTVVSLLSDVVGGMRTEEITPPKRRTIVRAVNGKSTKTAVAARNLLETMEAGRSYNWKDPTLTEAMTGAGMAPASVSSLLSILVQTGRVKRIGRGIYMREH